MSGWLFLVAGLVVGGSDFVVGFRFSRMSGEQLERLPDGSVRSPDGMRRLGRTMMLLAPVVFLALAALAFGLIPDTGIEPIRLGAS